MSLRSKFSVRTFLAAVVVLASCSQSNADDVVWTGATAAWETGFVWNSGSVPTNEDFALIPFGNVTVSDSTGTVDIRGFRQTGGTLNITGGTVEAGQVRQFSDFDGTVTQSGGFASINMVRVGASANSNGSYTLDGGELRVARAISDVSLQLGGLTSGTGSMTIADGAFTVRQSVYLGGSASTGEGTFTVLGSQSSIKVGDNGVNGLWDQSAGSSLVLRFDTGGTTPISIRDNGGGIATSATFENGAILDVDHLEVDDDFGGSWTVMEVQNGDIINGDEFGDGLQFAPGVDTSIWSFAVDNTGSNGKLIVTAVGEPACGAYRARGL